MNQMIKASMSNNTKKSYTKVLLKKRRNEWGNETVTRCHQILPYTIIDGVLSVSNGDRFIARRNAISVDYERKLKFPNKTVIKDAFKLRLTANYWQQNGITQLMNEMFDIRACRLLKFTETAHERYARRDECNGSDWSCRPRAKPLIFPSATHDLPGFNTFFDYNLVDWSVNGQIAASFGHDVIVWNREKDITLMFSITGPRALKYCPNGLFLAVGCKSHGFPVMELWGVEDLGQFTIDTGKVFSMNHGDLRSIEWDRTSSHIICGMQNGAILVLAVPELSTVKRIRRHHKAVTIIRLSPTMRYFASGDEHGNVNIYNWDSCQIHVYVRSKSKLSVIFDWHPWNGADLVISEDRPASICILHVPSKQIVAFYQRHDKSMIINSVSFSKLTGELLVSVSKNDSGGCIDFKVLVMASLDRVVDVIRETNGARFMIWSPDGTKVATAGNDETLTIWQFYSENKVKHKNNNINNSNNNNKSNKSNMYRQFTTTSTENKLLASLDFGNEFKKWLLLR